MAKGDALGAYTPSNFSGASDSDQTRWMYQELTRIALVLNLGISRNVEETNVAPSKPRDGMIVFADGTNWDPGSGRGFYGYYTGAWHKLG